ncbi:MAG: hypothetical protein D6748_02425 [Calditrichaeota bacterium]|nr:MAG: hypothetical protein D6748_02425 [Calditrichota bacterium]
MSNSKLRLKETLSGSEQEELLSLITRLSKSTDELYQAATRGEWNVFQQHLERRGETIEALKRFVHPIPESDKTEPDLQNSKDNIRDQLHKHLKKVTKVNTEVYDIIKRRKDELLKHILNGNKGLRFLKNFEKQVNQQKIISKTY